MSLARPYDVILYSDLDGQLSFIYGNFNKLMSAVKSGSVCRVGVITEGSPRLMLAL